MLPRLPAVISAVLLLTLPLACAPVDAGERARLRVCVADFRPEQAETTRLGSAHIQGRYRRESALCPCDLRESLAKGSQLSDCRLR